MKATKTKQHRRKNQKATLPAGLANELRDNLSPHSIALLAIAAGEYSRIKPRGHFADSEAAGAYTTACRQLSWFGRALAEELGGYERLNSLLADIGQ